MQQLICSVTEQGECEKVAGGDREDWKENQNYDMVAAVSSVNMCIYIAPAMKNTGTGRLHEDQW
jgi:hypothetical protein